MPEHNITGQEKQKKPDQYKRISITNTQAMDQNQIAWDISSNLGEMPFNPPIQTHAMLFTKASPEQRVGLARQLQQSYGNKYVQRLIESLGVQTKLVLSDPNDIYEKEANQVAERVTQWKSSEIQRQEEEEELQVGSVSEIQGHAGKEDLQMIPDKNGEFDLDSSSGGELITHELTHVLQQVDSIKAQRQEGEAQSGEQKTKDSDVTYYIKYVQEDTMELYQKSDRMTKEVIETTQESKWDNNTMTDVMGYQMSENGDTEEYQRITWRKPDGSVSEEIHIVSYNKAQNKTTINHDLVENGFTKKSNVDNHEGPPKFSDWNIKP